MAMAVIQSVFSIESMIRGYLVYQDVWLAVLDEELTCRREPFTQQKLLSHTGTFISRICLSYGSISGLPVFQ